jgi:flagellar biosynthesis protein
MDQPKDDLAKRRAAVALTYDAQLQIGAPKVVAKGYNQTAQRIMELAREAGVPVTESAELARALMNVQLDREIPGELYAAVAEILAWVWRLQNGMSTAPR